MSKIDLSTEALLARRDLAKKATPGPWRKLPGRSLIVSMASEDEPLICDARKAADAAHIIANSPDVVIATVDELLRLREENERLDREAEWLADKLKQYKGPSITYKGEIMSLREAARRAVEEVCAKN